MQDTAPKFNRSAIMKRAWEIVRKGRYNLINMRYAMYQAWREAKLALLSAKEVAQHSIRTQLTILQNKSRLTDADYKREAELNAQLVKVA